MKIVRSINLTLAFPDTRKSYEAFSRALEFLAANGINSVEFYYDGDKANQLGHIISNSKLRAVFICVVPSKEQQLWLCDTDKDLRAKAVKMFCGCMDLAQDNGIRCLMLNSGRARGGKKQALAAFRESVIDLYNYAEKRNYVTSLKIEPCDSSVEAFHLVGSYTMAGSFATDLRESGYPIELIMDTAHVSEEGEDFITSLKETLFCCNHIHFANCMLSDKTSPLYGDKHLTYDIEQTVWPYIKLRKLWDEIIAFYPQQRELTVGIEYLCREKDPFACFDRIWSNFGYLQS